MTSPEPPRQPPARARERVALRRAHQRARRWRVRLGVGAVVALVLLAAAGLVLRRASQTLATIQQDDPRRRTPAALRATSSSAPVRPGGQAKPAAPPLDGAGAALPGGLDRPVNVLLIGVDKRPSADEGVRSDTLILVHLDPQAKWASMLSIPRDSVVDIPRIGQAKINTAYANGYSAAAQIYGAGTAPDAGGSALAAETVEQFLGVRVDYTAQVDFHGFAQLVNVVGGVLVDVPRPLLDAEFPTDDYGVERIYIPAGLQVLDGRQALVYARSRHSSSDFDRSVRQQQVLRALLAQVKARGLLENVGLLPQWADVLAQNIRTTLPVRDLALLQQMATFARDLDSARVVQMSINPNDVGIEFEGGSDIVWNRADVLALVAKWQTGPADRGQGTGDRGQGSEGQVPPPVVGGASSVVAPGEQARVQVLNGAAVEGVAGNVSAFLRAQGFALADADTAPQVYAHTVIIDYTGRPQTRQRLAAVLGVEPRFVQSTPAADAPPPSQADILVVVGQDYKLGWVGP